MDAHDTSGAHLRRSFLHWYGAVAAAFLLAGGGCLAFGRSGEVAWLKRHDWHLNYDHLGALLLWIGALLMLPQLTSSLMERHVRWRNAGVRRRVGFLAGAVMALLVLVNAPDNLSISRYREPVTMDDGGDASLNDSTLHTKDSYEFAGFRDFRWRRWADDDAESHVDPGMRTTWHGAHASWHGTQDTYAWRVRPDAESPYSDAVADQPPGYECLVRSMSFFGPLRALHLVNIDSRADPGRYPSCQLMIRVGDRTLTPEAITQAYLTLAGDTPLARAVAEFLPEMYSPAQGTSSGEEKLTLWMYAHPQTWGGGLNGLPKTDMDMALKDIQRQRGKVVCVSGKVQYITQMPLGDVTVYTGGLRPDSIGSVRLFAAGSVGTLTQAATATFCGVVIGTFLTSGVGEETHSALDLVGMFDVPENHR